MRCEDLTRELASPTGAFPPAEIARHLAACPACDEWSRLAGRLDRAWEATRPLDPSPEMMDALWARVSCELDARKAPVTIQFAAPARRRPAWVKSALIAAQAAAILVAASLLLLRRDEVRPFAVVAVADVEPGASDLLKLDVEDDTLSVVRIDKGNRHQVERLASPALPAANTPHDEVSEMEALDSSFGTVASK